MNQIAKNDTLCLSAMHCNQTCWHDLSKSVLAPDSIDHRCSSTELYLRHVAPAGRRSHPHQLACLPSLSVQPACPHTARHTRMLSEDPPHPALPTHSTRACTCTSRKSLIHVYNTPTDYLPSPPNPPFPHPGHIRPTSAPIPSTCTHTHLHAPTIFSRPMTRGIHGTTCVLSTRRDPQGI